MFQNMLNTIQKYTTIIIHRHSRPDGDALGSQIGLKYLLQENFPEKTVYMVGDGAGYLSFMDGAVMDTVPDSAYDGALAILLDSSSPQLISDDRWKTAAATARFDHHMYQGKFTDIEIADNSYESCCGLIAQFAMDCGLRLNPAAAKALYTGMVTDSGRFRYDATSPRTFRLAAHLLEQGFDTNRIYRDLYADDYDSKRLKAQFIMNVRFTPNKVAYIYTTLEDFKALGLDTFTVSRGMVNTMADIRGVDIWVNFTETETGLLCELRSAAKNINPIAVKYGGGGHAKASGATVKDRATAMEMLRDLDALTGEAK